jgi:hypothetical protein
MQSEIQPVNASSRACCVSFQLLRRFWYTHSNNRLFCFPNQTIRLSAFVNGWQGMFTPPWHQWPFSQNILRLRWKIFEHCNTDTILRSYIPEWAIISTYIGDQTFILIQGMAVLIWVWDRDKVLILVVRFCCEKGPQIPSLVYTGLKAGVAGLQGMLNPRRHMIPPLVNPRLAVVVTGDRGCLLLVSTWYYLWYVQGCVCLSPDPNSCISKIVKLTMCKT